MKNVFISYSSKDISKVTLIKESIVDQCTVWMAPESIPAGSSYAEIIPTAIEDADYFLLILSPNSCNSIWVEKEIDTALRFHKKVIPFIIENVELSPSYSFYLSNCQAIDATDDYTTHIADLIEEVNSGESDSTRSLSWSEKYVSLSKSDYSLTNTVFTFLELQYMNKEATSLELEDLVLQFRKIKAKKLDYTTLQTSECRYLLHGIAGCGKSTYLQKLFFDCCNFHTTDTLPVFIKLPTYSPGRLMDLSLIYEAVSASLSKNDLSYDTFVETINDYKLICLFDAYDEYSIDDDEKRMELLDEIENFSRKFNCSIVMTTRTEKLPTHTSFDKVLIQPLYKKQRIEFIRKYFDYFGIHASPRAFYSKLSSNLANMLKTPLLLSMVVAAYISTGQILDSPKKLYNLIIRKLLSTKPLLEEDVISTDDKFLVISGVAFEMLLTGRTYLTYNAFMRILEERVTRYEIDIDPFSLYKDYIHSSLINVAYNRISFFHASIMEYLSECEISREFNFEAKADMDQYFLKNGEKIKKIMNCVAPNEDDIIMEVGAGIGTVSLKIPAYKELYLVDLDEGLCKILTYTFRDWEGVSVFQEDAIKMIKTKEFTKLISNLPFFLTDDVLNALKDKEFEVAVMSVRIDDDLSVFDEYFSITDLQIINETDFFPHQPFKSRIIMIKKR